MSRPEPQRAFFQMLIQRLDEGQVPLVQRIFSQFSDDWEVFEWRYIPDYYSLAVTGKVQLVDPEHAEELLDIVFGLWMEFEEFMDAFLTINPREPGEKHFSFDEDDYAEWKADIDADRAYTKRKERFAARRKGQPDPLAKPRRRQPPRKR